VAGVLLLALCGLAFGADLASLTADRAAIIIVTAPARNRPSSR